ncbi:PLP-dependent aminotransferase family protein [Bordetella genomosp. 12]|uniref:2-aminoadipate aminotransferase n=1 Tax=Bordetella genomosp. 12 TaxID=463035 RepID=A0A261VBC0_9BORD|nr:2-aminoadipate aminotransferase [Bordetella genomosp. 12]
MYDFVPAYVAPAGSPIRELHKYVGLPDMISFAAGYPDGALFDVEGVQRAFEQAYADPRRCLQYTGTEGLPVLRDALRSLMVGRAAQVEAENLLVTTGSQQGFDLLLRVLMQPGDICLVEQPAYPATLQALRMHQARIVGLHGDEGGIDTARLRAWLAEHHAAQPIKALYTVPTFSNPTGRTLSVQRRRELLELAVQYRFLVVEDDPYSELRFEGPALPSLLTLAADIPGASDWVVHLSSLSKVIAGGLRVGWMIAHPDIIKRCVIAKQTSDLCCSSLTQAVAAAYLSSGDMDRHFPKVIASYRDKCVALIAALQASFGTSIRVEHPQGGMFLWARCEEVDAARLLAHAIDNRVLFVPGGAFYAESGPSPEFRLSFASPSRQELATGAQRLHAAYQQSLA